MTKQKQVQETKETLYSKSQIVNSKKYSKYKDLLMSILEDSKGYSNKEIDIKIKQFLERKV